ncbi:MAG TPA: transcriptional repressor [Chthoniobacteraceae bacterium]|nr:transcriptional repressor [Chthoniobacteraceae bacterium]
MRQKTPAKSYDERISEKGFRFTEQRRRVYDELMAKRDHPTAVEVFLRVKTRMPSISLATVYNCLETLTECGLVKHVHHHREPSRYCPNLAEHAHLFCERCGSVTDLPLRMKRRTQEIWDLPAGIIVAQPEISFRGLCVKCARQKKPARVIEGRSRLHSTRST